MAIAILADIHSNLEALEAVLKDIEEKGGVEGVWCLGDVVGYGPDPHLCLERLRGLNPLCVAGNHDWAATGEMDLATFNPHAAAAARWTVAQLAPEDVEYLRGLLIVQRADAFTLVHGSPREPVWEYLLGPWEARENFSYFPTRFCLVGHSHIPILFEEDGKARSLPERLDLGKERLILNPGAVGQPRDGDPRASYAIYDGEGVIYHFRIPYDFGSTQKKMAERGLPPALAYRLRFGW
jgi:diadenosine tetraphosphatase ApaH/serine/threonine PP2A family protein phosphatase